MMKRSYCSKRCVIPFDPLKAFFVIEGVQLLQSKIYDTEYAYKFMKAMLSFIRVKGLCIDAIRFLMDCHLSFDACNVRGDLVYMKSSGKLLGLTSDFLDFRFKINKQLDQSGFLICLRSNPYSSFRFPLAIIGVSSESSDKIVSALFLSLRI